jgi:succinyl-CoA synthetase alpha subunit
MFEEDSETRAIVLLGEIGGTMEEEAADYISKHSSKPVVALIVGRHAPEGERMGHAGAIIQHGRGRAEGKIRALKEAGVHTVMSPREIPRAIREAL